MPSFTDTLKVNGQDMAMYASLPSGPGPHPAVVIAFHVGGVDEFDKFILVLYNFIKFLKCFTLVI